jgi:23S rRNA (adenine1618-N6)-methyltransferase
MKKELHPRNRHRDRYDFKQLIQGTPELARFVAIGLHGEESIDFSNPKAVKSLNRAILHHFYGVSNWDIPAHYLCPPIPGRADYLHHAADLLASSNKSNGKGEIPRGPAVRVLDIGVGANCVYPLIGHAEYGWSFLGSEIDPIALSSANKILAGNRGLALELRLQPSPSNILRGLLKAGERFDLSICNPPFHASLDEAQDGSRRKWRNLGKGKAQAKAPVLNFGGQGTELWCEGGEAAFVGRMIEESAGMPEACLWFTTLLSKETNLPGVQRALTRVKAREVRTIEMQQGQKRSRIVAWTFH